MTNVFFCTTYVFTQKNLVFGFQLLML